MGSICASPISAGIVIFQTVYIKEVEVFPTDRPLEIAIIPFVFIAVTELYPVREIKKWMDEEKEKISAILNELKKSSLCKNAFEIDISSMIM